MAHEDLPAPAPFAPPGEGTVVVYRGATLIDGTGAAARTGMTIVTDGQRITAVAPDAQAEVPADAQVVDLTGRYVIPGLIDSHQHIATPPNRPVAEAALRRQIYGGVTAIRDMADDLRQIADLTRATLVGEIPGPDIRYAALMAGPDFFDDPRTWQVSQGETPGHVPWMQAIDAHTELPLAVAMARGTHATAIKVYADLEADAVARIVDEAHRQDLVVWAHAAVFPASPGEVVAAGVDVVSHASLLAFAATDEPLTRYKSKPAIDVEVLTRDGDPRLDALYGEMAERGTILDATASMWIWLADDTDDEEARARMLANIDLCARITGDAYRAGVPIVAGTDYETSPDQPFPSLHDEMIFLVRRCGIPAAEVIRCATQVAARAAGAQALMGTVEPGKLANLVVLTGDPGADIERIRDIDFVVKRGQRFDRADFAIEEAAR